MIIPLTLTDFLNRISMLFKESVDIFGSIIKIFYRGRWSLNRQVYLTECGAHFTRRKSIRETPQYGHFGASDINF